VLDPLPAQCVTDSGTEAPHRRKQVRGGIHPVRREELGEPLHALRAAEWEAERGMQAGPSCGRGAWEICVVGYVGDPGRLPGTPDAAGQPDAEA
jgi:hypothetical protein